MKNKIFLAGVKIDSITRKQAVDILLDFSKRSFRRTACYVNAHCINIACLDQEYKSMLNKSDLVYAGGQGVVWASRFIGTPLPERVNILDFFDRLVPMLKQGNIRVYLLGGQDLVVKKTRDALEKKGLDIAGARHGFFDEKEESDIIKEINRLRPNLLMVGMGVPKQEKWIWENLKNLDVNLCWGVGAAFEWLSGNRKRAPQWMVNYGMEWLHRLYQEPKRLWKRYLIGNFIFVFNVLCHKFKSQNEKLI